MIERNKIIDFHAHILPGADHGSGSVSVSQKQLEHYVNAGIEKVVATPHFYPQEMRLDEFLSRREKAVEELKGILHYGSPRVYLGAEVLLCHGLENMQGIEKLCIEGTNCILLEQPFYGLDEGMIQSAENIRKMGLYPVMAHIDRYDKAVVNAVLEADFLCQINAESLVKIFKKKKILKYVDEGHICALGSDIHGSDGLYIETYIKACGVLGEERTDHIFERSSELLNGAVPVNK